MCLISCVLTTLSITSLRLLYLRSSWECMESVGCSGHKSQHKARHTQERRHAMRLFVISNQGQVIMWEKVCGKAFLFQCQEENQEWYGNNLCGENDVYFKLWLGIHLAVLTDYTQEKPGSSMARKNAEMLSLKAGKHRARLQACLSIFIQTI